jgi:hypothetical protein
MPPLNINESDSRANAVLVRIVALRVKESLGVVQGRGNWKVVSVKKKDRSFAAVESGFNSRLTHIA